MGLSEGLRIEVELVTEIEAKVATVILGRSRLCSTEFGRQQKRVNRGRICQALKVHEDDTWAVAGMRVRTRTIASGQKQHNNGRHPQSHRGVLDPKATSTSPLQEPPRVTTCRM